MEVEALKKMGQWAMKATGITGRQVRGIFTDIDNTFYLPGREAAMAKIVAFARERRMPIIAITGAGFDSVFGRMTTGKLPWFRAIASAVGTEIFVRTGPEGYTQDMAWDNKLRSRFDRVQVMTEAEKLVRKWRVLYPTRELVIQPKKVAQPYKVSFYFRADGERFAGAFADEIRERFPEHRFAWCEDINWQPEGGGVRRQYCADVLAATKIEAVDYLVDKFGITAGIVAGDSGNDADMILDCDRRFVGLVVGGARPELLARIEKYSGPISWNDSLVELRLSDFRAILVDRDSNRKGPESILEALKMLF